MTKPVWLRVFSLIGFLHCSSPLASAPLPVHVDLAPFSTQLNQATITAIHKDKGGFLWIGTQSGLNRYDGSGITVFDSNGGTEHWVPASYISQIAEGSDGSIWIATYGGGLARYNGAKQTFEEIPVNPEGTYSFLKSLLVSNSEKVWFGTLDAGIGMYDPKLQRYALWLDSHSINKDMGQASDLLEDRSGRIWASGKKGLYLIDPTQQSITLFPVPTKSGPNNPLLTVTAIEMDTSETIWVGTSEGKILQFSIPDLDYKNEQEVLDFSGSWIMDLFYEGERLWIATDNGLSIRNKTGSSIKTFTQSNSSLSSNVTICLSSGNGSIYVGTDQGLDVFSSSIFEKYQRNNSQIYNDVTSFSESPDSKIFVGTFDGIFLQNDTDRTHTPLENIFGKLNLSDRRVTTMDIRKNEIWLGYFQGGVQIINLENGESRLLNLPHNSDLAITKIIHSKDGRSWVGTYNQGLYQIDEKSIISHYQNNNPEHNIPEISIISITETNDGSLIVGSETALYQIDSTSGNVQPLEIFFHDKKTKPVILSMAQNISGDIWIGIKDLGLFIWSSPGNTSTKIYPEFAKGNTSLPGSTIYAIEFDEAGNAWVSTTGGISKLNSVGELTKNYTTADGLQGADFNLSSSFRDSQGRIYFGGSNGYNRFDPTRETDAIGPPPVVLIGINIAGREPSLPVAVHELEAIELSYKDYFTTFEFSVLDFTDPRNNQYRYKLENFDPEWIENGTRNSATYTNLPPGVYTFRVVGANSAGVWNLQGSSIRVVVHAAPWWSWQAYLCYFLLLYVFAVGMMKYYDNNALRKKAAIMTQEAHDIADRATDDLQEQLEYRDEFVRVVHDHSVKTLELIGDFITQQANLIDDDLVKDSILNNTSRVAALAQLEACLFYQEDRLLANLEIFTNSIMERLMSESPSLENSIITINEMPSRLVPVELATQLAIIIFELLQNCFQHAFESSSSANYIQIRIDKVTGNDQITGRNYSLSIKDSGVGIPDNISLDHIETPGLAIVSSVTRKMDGVLNISREKGTNISIAFFSQWDIV